MNLLVCAVMVTWERGLCAPPFGDFPGTWAEAGDGYNHFQAGDDFAMPDVANESDIATHQALDA
jgi:hypothetical protein